MLVIVHQLADRRLGVGHNFDQIQSGLLGQLQRALRGQYAQLGAVRADYAHLAVADFFVDHQFGSYVDAPPS